MPHFARALRLFFLAAGLSAALAAVAPMSAVAQVNLDAARAAGLIGERPDGLVGIVAAPSAEVESLVKEINSRRLSQYQEIALRTGTSLPAVQAVAGEKAIQQSPAGSFVMDGKGSWRRK